MNQGLPNQSKKQLSQIGEDLNIKKKLKKQELCQEIANKLVNIIMRQENNYDIRGNRIPLTEMTQLNNNPNIKPIIQKFYDNISRKQIENMRPNQMQVPMAIPHFPVNQQMYPIPSYEYMQNLMGPQMPVFAPQSISNANGINNMQGTFGNTLNQTQCNCICQYIPRLRQSAQDIESNFIYCVNTNECKRKYHASCMKITTPEQKRFFECPYCILKNMDPLHQVKEIIIMPQPLRQNSPNQLQFFLKEDQYNQIYYKKQNQDIFGLELRCIRIDGKSFYETTWPDYGELEINDQRVLEFKPLQMNSSLKKRKDEKYFFREIQILRQGWNSICIKEIQATQELKHNYRISDNSVHIIALYLVKKMSVESLAEQLKINNLRSEAECKDNIMQYFKASKEEVSIDKLNVSLNCQFDFKMINTPAKSKWCKHIQCFSLENFIIVTESTVPRKWKCPICKVKCYDVIVDEYLWKIIKKCKQDNINVSEVTIDQNADYKIEKIQNDDSDQDDLDDDSIKNENNNNNNNSLTVQNGNNAIKTDQQSKNLQQNAQNNIPKQIQEKQSNNISTNGNNAAAQKMASEIIILDEDEVQEQQKNKQNQQDKVDKQVNNQPKQNQQPEVNKQQNKNNNIINANDNAMLCEQNLFTYQYQQPPKPNMNYQQQKGIYFEPYNPNQYFFPINCQNKIQQPIQQNEETIIPQNNQSNLVFKQPSSNTTTIETLNQQQSCNSNSMDIENKNSSIIQQNTSENNQQMNNLLEKQENQILNNTISVQDVTELQQTQQLNQQEQTNSESVQQSEKKKQQIQSIEQESQSQQNQIPLENTNIDAYLNQINNQSTNMQIKDEPEDLKLQKEFYKQNLKDSHFIYKSDNNFDEFLKFMQDGNYEEKKTEYQSKKIKQIIQRKLVKNIKRQFPESALWIKKDQNNMIGYGINQEFNQSFTIQSGVIKQKLPFSPTTTDKKGNKHGQVNNGQGFGMEYVFQPQPGFNPPNFPQFQNANNLNRPPYMGHFMPIHSQQNFLQTPQQQQILFPQNQIKPSQQIKKSQSTNGTTQPLNQSNIIMNAPHNQELKKKGKNTDEAICIDD